MNPRGYTILPSAPPSAPPSVAPHSVAPSAPHTAMAGTAPPAFASCYACRLYLSDPLLLCGCGCRIPIHPTCYTALSLRNAECPVCRQLWTPLSSNQSVIETIAEHPLTNTECAPSCSTRWMLYSLVCLVIGIGALFLFFYFIK